MLDIHSHILPEVDDGAEALEESIALLEAMKKQGITAVMATPHFYPHEDSLAEFSENVALAYKKLLKATENMELPNIYLGSEILYFEGMGHSQSLGSLCLGGSQYLLIELTDECIGDSLMYNLEFLKENSNIIPIIAHVERYFRAKNYRKFIKFLKNENIIVQINASSFLESVFDRVINKLIKSNITVLVGTDAHSLATRPPQMQQALSAITKKYGKATANRILRNIDIIHRNIISNGDCK